jgi:anti-sigma factor RsiW
VTEPSWEELNAYVDGELAAEEAARVARAVADNPALAEQVARLTRLKALVDADAADMPEIRIAPMAVRRRLGAAAAGLAAIAAAALLALYALPGNEVDAGTERALAAHEAWAEFGAGQSANGVSAASYLAASQALGPRLYIPDLSAARLRVVRVSSVAARGGNPAAVHVGYAGTRGCRISLWVAPAGPRIPETPTARGDGSNTVFSWRVGSLGYTMIASGMDAERFDLIVRAAHRATKDFAPPESETRIALRRSRDVSAPCRG